MYIVYCPGQFRNGQTKGDNMISKNQRQLILNLIEKYGSLRETYGRYSKDMDHVEREELKGEIRDLYREIETFLICSK